MPAVPRLIRAANAWTAEPVGISKLHELFMVNTKHGGRRARPNIIDKIHEAWAKEHGYRDKDQASSLKPEELNAANSERFVKAASSKVF